MVFKLTYKPYGERAILVEWPAIIDETVLKDIIGFKTAILKNSIESIVELKSAYNSLLITYNTVCRNFENEVFTLGKIYKSHDFEDDKLSKLWKIPVCYDPVFGIDLEAISIEKSLSKEAIIERHSQTIYTVYFIGFLPGFLYLGGLDETLNSPRKSTPRLKIEKGSVAIGGTQTGVYPTESPGGWNVIGNCPLNFFDVNKDVPCFAKPGDHIQFYPVSLKEHQSIKKIVDAGVYQIEREAHHG